MQLMLSHGSYQRDPSPLQASPKSSMARLQGIHRHPPLSPRPRHRSFEPLHPPALLTGTDLQPVSQSLWRLAPWYLLQRHRLLASGVFFSSFALSPDSSASWGPLLSPPQQSPILSGSASTTCGHLSTNGDVEKWVHPTTPSFARGKHHRRASTVPLPDKCGERQPAC